ncbi:hypothetical protein E2C01_050535 [Portunus trituberculatus]|uniref:Uncharacterized protein n=1 Tax=Portunus trituberculatus TaxID=210409 RepID=A0A5B7GJ82_PORTR|nr:hypothetical protein [Portunus trituberculatus]
MERSDGSAVRLSISSQNPKYYSEHRLKTLTLKSQSIDTRYRKRDTESLLQRGDLQCARVADPNRYTGVGQERASDASDLLSLTQPRQNLPPCGPSLRGAPLRTLTRLKGRKRVRERKGQVAFRFLHALSNHYV